MDEESMVSVFDLEKQYQFYLKKVNLKESLMSPVQKIETKRAYFAACAQMLLIFRDGIGGIEKEDEAIATMQDMMDQAILFWNTTVL